MQFKTMLDKILVIFFVFKNIKMIYNRYAWIILRAYIVIMLKSNMDKNINLIIMPQHWLHLILDFKIIIFSEINNWNHITSK